MLHEIYLSVIHMPYNINSISFKLIIFGPLALMNNWKYAWIYIYIDYPLLDFLSVVHGLLTMCQRIHTRTRVKIDLQMNQPYLENCGHQYIVLYL